jgi:putative ABC transport system permease protein
MTITYVLLQNLKRNRLRTALTVAAFALPMAVFVGAISFVTALHTLRVNNEKQLRLAVHQKQRLTSTLPSGHRRRIEALDPDHTRLAAVCGMRWYGGRVPDTQNTLTSLGADKDTFPIVYSDLGMTAEEIEAWNRNRIAAVTGVGLAKTYGWKVGDRVTLDSTVPPYLSLEFKIVKIVPKAERGNIFYFRRDYLQASREEVGFEDDRCHIFWVKCNSAAGLRSLQGDIDTRFANTPDETKSEDENAFSANFTQALGDIPGLMQALAGVIVTIIALVAGNTMMMSFRERTRELAVFKALGFQRGRVFAIVLAESTFLSVVGALLGIVPVSLFLWMSPLRIPRMGPVSQVEVSVSAIAGALGIAVAVGIIAGFWPAYQAMKLRTVDALRRVA